jgi:hypothetical protein
MSPEMRIAPITPEQAREEHYIPDEIMQIVNDLLAERGAYSRYITLYQDEIVEKAIAAGLNRGEIFSKHWLDFEDKYRQAGWDVKYDRPAYNETGREVFRFSLPGTRVRR